ncbi:MAG: hypothetical protein COB53_09660 [Elusimicrobia bacterium]|nr:MAG: hypothetical protein COB53_09660 [Elusimicrobiota bacterium]
MNTLKPAAAFAALTLILSLGLSPAEASRGMTKAPVKAAGAPLYGTVSRPWGDSFARVFRAEDFTPRLRSVLPVIGGRNLDLSPNSELWAPVATRLQTQYAASDFSAAAGADEVFLTILAEEIRKIQGETRATSAAASDPDTPLDDLPGIVEELRQRQTYSAFLSPDLEGELNNGMQHGRHRFWKERGTDILAGAESIAERLGLPRDTGPVPTTPAGKDLRSVLKLAPENAHSNSARTKPAVESQQEKGLAWKREKFLQLKKILVHSRPNQGTYGQLAAYLDAGDYVRVGAYFIGRSLPGYVSKQGFFIRQLYQRSWIRNSRLFRERTELGGHLENFSDLTMENSDVVKDIDDRIEALYDHETPSELEEGLKNLVRHVAQLEQNGKISQMYARFTLGEASKPIWDSPFEADVQKRIGRITGEAMKLYSGSVPAFNDLIQQP